MEFELSKLFGRKVDLQTPGFLGKEILRLVQKEAIPAYEQA
jgi:predicted nucleotidyltransferase